MRRKFLIIVLALVGISLILFSILLALGVFKPKNAGLLIETEPVSTVYIDGKKIGQTPLDINFEAKEVFLEIMPEDVSLGKWETNVKLTPGIKTIVKRSFNVDSDYTSSAIVSFEKAAKNETLLTVVSVPESSQIYLDGRSYGFTPLRINITPGEHKFVVSSPGYLDKSLQIRAYKGYKLTAVTKLSKNGSYQGGSAKTNQEQITISGAGGEYANVYKEADFQSEVLGKVSSGETFDVLDKSSGTNDPVWYKIEFESIVYGENGGIPTKFQGWVNEEVIESSSHSNN